jgi:hypothetical protein
MTTGVCFPVGLRSASERPDGAAENGNRPDSTTTCKEVTIVMFTLPRLPRG